MGEGGSDFEYRIKTTASVEELVAYRKELEADRKALLELGKSAIEVDRRIKQVNAQLRQSRDGGANGLTGADMAQSIGATPGRFQRARAAYSAAGGGMAGLRAGIGALGAGAAAGLGAATIAAAAGAKAIDEFADAEERVVALDAALAQRGLGNDDWFSATLQKRAQALQDLTGVASGEWVDVFTKLIQFGESKSGIEESTEAVKNLAGFLGGDLTTAANMVGKAINGNFEGFRRLRFSYDENATKAENLARLYKELAERGGGQLEARNDTLNGSFRKLGNATADLFQNIGGGLAAVLHLKDGVNLLAAGVASLANIFSSTIPKSKALKDATRTTGAAMQSDEEIVRRYARAMDEMRKNSSGAATEMERVVAAIRAKAQQEQSVDDAKTAALLARVDQDEKGGRLTGVQAAQRRSQITRAAEETKARREIETRNAEIQRVEAAADVIQRQVDTANRNADDQRKRLEEVKRLADARQDIANKGEMRVAIANSIFEESSGPDRQVARGRMLRRKYDAIEALRGFDEKHGSLDVAGQERAAKEAKEAAKKINEELYPKATEMKARAIELGRDRDATARRFGWEAESSRIARRGGIRDARADERGSVDSSGGGLSGSPAAVRLAEQQRADQEAFASISAGRGGAQRAQAALRARDQEITRLNEMLEALSKLTNVNAFQETKIRQISDRIARLESWGRNNPGR